MERKLTKVVDGTGITVTGISENKFSGSSDKKADKSHSLSSRKMCSYGTDVANDLCSWECHDTCGVCNNDAALWKREEKVGFDYKMLCSLGKN